MTKTLGILGLLFIKQFPLIRFPSVFYFSKKGRSTTASEYAATLGYDFYRLFKGIIYAI
jgi:hypothetical protein